MFFQFLLAPWSVISHYRRSLVLALSSPAAMAPFWSLLLEVDLCAACPFCCSGNSFSSTIHCLIAWGFFALILLESLVHFFSCGSSPMVWGILVLMLSDNFARNLHAVRPLSSGNTCSDTGWWIFAPMFGRFDLVARLSCWHGLSFSSLEDYVPCFHSSKKVLLR